MAHTPGPWHLEGCRQDGSFEIWNKPLLKGDIPSDGFVICGRSAIEHRAAISRANARLIVAAPDMLAALQQAVALADGNLPRFSGRTGQCAKSYDACVAAIIKATAAPPDRDSQEPSHA